MLIVCIIGGWLYLLPYEFEYMGKHLIGSAFLLPNIVLWQESGYFDADAESKPLLHLWSLGFDGSHLSDFGADFLVEKIAKELFSYSLSDKH